MTKAIYCLLIFSFCLILFGHSGCTLDASACLTEQFPAYEKHLDSLRQKLNIPALSVAVVQDTQVVWSKGLGWADIENEVRATDTTTYLLASLTKTFASTILMQLVEQGKIELDDPISKYGVSLDKAREYEMNVSSEDSITVRHLFTHTAEGTPGEAYSYNGYLFSLLGDIIETASGKSFGELVMTEIIKPLRMKHTAPNISDTANFRLAGFDSAAFSANLAKPYAMDSLHNLRQTGYEPYFGVSAGLMTSAVDMAKYSLAIDRGMFLSPATWKEVITPAVSNAGDTLPYALGWFVQNYNGLDLIWHYGLWHTNSSLILKVPQKNLSLILLANSNGLTLPFSMGEGDVLTSLFATDFLQRFVFEEQEFPSVDFELPLHDLTDRLQPYVSAKCRDRMVQQMFGFVRYYSNIGQPEKADNLLLAYDRVFTRALPTRFEQMQELARIDSVENDADRSVAFKLDEATEVNIFAIGESSLRMVDYGWIEKVKDGEIVWEMNAIETTHAGGDSKNRMLDTKLVLPKGRYRLRYRSDDSHAYLQWNAEPPEYSFYGIAVFKAD